MFVRCNGDMLGAAILLPDAIAPGIAVLEQLALQRDPSAEERAACASALLARAQREAEAAGQRCLVVRPLPKQLQVEGGRWLEAAGFLPPSTFGVSAIAALSRSLAGAAAYKELDGS